MSTYGLSTSAANSALPTGTVYIQVHTGAPGAAGTTAVSAGCSTRTSATFGTASGGAVSLTTTPSFTNTGTTETLTAISWWSASTGGTYMGCGQLGSSQAWASGNVYSLSSVTVTIPTAA